MSRRQVQPKFGLGIKEFLRFAKLAMTNIAKPMHD